MKKIIFLVLALLAWKHYYYVPKAPDLGPGILAGGAPYQNSTTLSSFREGDYTYFPRASFDIEARVLSVSKYYFDQKSRISPLDLAVGWEKMSDESVLENIDVWQEKRGYRWHATHNTLSNNEIISSSANIHIIPGSQSIAEDLNTIRIGDLVHIEGFLVDVHKNTGWRWRTSLKRNDIGTESSEILYVKSFSIEDPYNRLY